MDLVLKRTRSCENGIFSQLLNLAGDLIAVTLEHAYASQDDSYVAKLQSGDYVCVLGTHTLTHEPRPFEAYEIMNVQGHSNILFHIGNFNQDSEGCVLLGQSEQPTMITGSRAAFENFMFLQNGITKFNLTVIE